MLEISELHFLRPLWLLGLAGIPFVVFLLRRTLAIANRWQSAIAPELLAVLLDDAKQAARRWPVPIAVAGMALGCIGLAGPTWERLPVSVERQNDALVIVLDLSLSMYVEDVKPSRIERAKRKITDVLRARREGFTALVAYAGDAHTVAPLTDDSRTIENLLVALSPGMMPVFGSNPAQALELARGLFTNAGFAHGRILLVTDGIDRVNDVTQHAHPDYPISILGIGTSEGGPIPLDFIEQPGRFFETEQGVVVHPKLDGERLASVAELAFGRYRELVFDDADIEYLLAQPSISPDDTTDVDRDFDAWHDAGYWLVLPLLALALVGFRRGALVALAVAIVPTADADMWSDLWQRRDQQAFEALREGQPEVAGQLFEDERWRAVARYRSDDYRRAAEGFEHDATTTGQFNLGNAFAKMGEFEDALAAYSNVLERDPAHEDAAFNKQLIEELLSQKRQSEGNENQDQDKNSSQSDAQANPQSGQDQSVSPEDAEGQEPNDEQTGQQQDEREQDTQDGEEGDEQTDLADAQERETSDANEQWLRRVPDNPGGLLERKFKHETNLRMRRGEYRNNQRERIW